VTERSRTRVYRAAGLVALLAIVTALAATKYARPWMINPSPSMPVGIYELRPVDHPIARGDTVVVCAPPSVTAFAAAYHYLGPGPCSSNTEYVLKLVAAIAGDVVDLGPRTIGINGRCLVTGITLERDHARHVLPHVARGRYHLGPHQLWLWAPAARSFDSRYFGAVDARGVVNLASPAIIGGPAAELQFSTDACPAEGR
jgi:conjugative transfer signal peptidase TraF